MAISATAMVATATAMVAETTPLSAGMTADSAAACISVTSITAIEVAAVEVAAVGVPGVDISTIGIAAATICITATVVFALKTTSVKAAAVEISCIPSLEKRPVVGIVGIIPIVAVPDRVIIVCIPGELSCKGYSIAVSIPAWVGIGALICRIGFLVNRSRLLVNRSRNLGIAPGGDQQAGGCQGGECKDLFHFVCDFKLAAELVFLSAHPGYKKANREVYLTGVC